MICVAISDPDIDNCINTLNTVEMAEIRLDLTGFSELEIKKTFAYPTPTIATCRPNEIGTKKQAETLSMAIEAGANMVDIEIESDISTKKSLIEKAKEHGCKVIISYHNFENTPERDFLHDIAQKCYDEGADIAKLATMVNYNKDNANLLSLYSIEKPIVALGMGDKGKITRIISPLLGAAFTFAAMDSGKPTAPGQIKYSKIKELLQSINGTL